MLLSRNLKDNSYESIDTSLYQHQKLLSVAKKDHDKEYIDFDGDMIALNTDCSFEQIPEHKSLIEIPILPQRSALRTTTTLDKDASDLKTRRLNTFKELYNESILRSSDPHDLYLSSEEDISVKDSNEEFLFDSDDSDIEMLSNLYDKETQEVTAKAISFRVVGKPQIIEINCNSNNTSPRTSISLADHTRQRPLLPRLPILTFTLNDFQADTKDLFPSSQPTLSTPKHTDSLDSNTTLKEVKADSYYSPPKLTKSESEPNTSLSLFRRGSLLSRKSNITQSLLQMPAQATGNSSSTATKISSRITALKCVSRNIRNTGMSKISLAYTPGVVPRRK